MKEGYVLTNREDFNRFLEGIEEATVIVEASSTIDRIVSFLPGHNIRVANLLKVIMKFNGSYLQNSPLFLRHHKIWAPYLHLRKL